MRIKKYTARTEQEAIELVRDELGMSALVLNIKKTNPRGLKRLFVKPSVEITAAPEDERDDKQDEGAHGFGSFSQRIRLAERNAHIGKSEDDEEDEEDINSKRLLSWQIKVSELEQELDNKENLLEKAAGLLALAKYEASLKRKYDNNMIQIFYDALTAQGVTGEIAETLLYDVSRLASPTELPMIVKVVYNNILEILGEPEEAPSSGVFFFLGPTGVGKTTTIAKISSRFVFDSGVKVGLITADTYRIAAVEQLKTYAEILGIDIGIVYNADDLKDILPKMESFSDVVIVDTAGRSHKNAAMIQDLKALLQVRPDAVKYLVLSLTTKYEDLVSIIEAYGEFTDFGIIFTKADETVCLGTILNICYHTKKHVSYITNGQNVPDDIVIAEPSQIAKSLMGLGGGV